MKQRNVLKYLIFRLRFRYLDIYLANADRNHRHHCIIVKDMVDIRDPDLEIDGVDIPKKLL